jgi:TonB family protein
VVWHGPKAGKAGVVDSPKAPAAKQPKAIGRRPPRADRTPLEIARPLDLPPRTTPERQGDDPGSDGLGRNGPGPAGDGHECAAPPCGGGGDVVSEEVVAEMPVLLSAPDVVLSPEARRRGVEGTMLVRCVITATGSVDACEVLKGLPLADAAVLAALRARQYKPALVEGRAVSIRHLFTIKVKQAR